jgi:hypothetical protein
MLAWAVAAAPLAAQESGYTKWGDDAEDTGRDEMIERLNSLIDEAERARAADPQFLRDLRDAIADYDQPSFSGGSSTASSSSSLQDDFRDGDFTRDPRWTVVSGEFTVDRNLGLRSVVADAAQNTGDRKSGDRDLASVLLETLLKDSSKNNESGGSAEAAVIFTNQSVSNAFSLSFELVSRERSGRFAVALFQGEARDFGYRLAYLPGARPSLELLRFSRRGEAVIESLRETLNLEDGFRHRIELERTTGRRMTATVDGRTVIDVADGSFSDGFDGVEILNEGGDYAIREIALSGRR